MELLHIRPVTFEVNGTLLLIGNPMYSEDDGYYFDSGKSKKHVNGLVINCMPSHLRDVMGDKTL